jgi:hypothetical protein
LNSGIRYIWNGKNSAAVDQEEPEQTAWNPEPDNSVGGKRGKHDGGGRPDEAVDEAVDEAGRQALCPGARQILEQMERLRQADAGGEQVFLR